MSQADKGCPRRRAYRVTRNTPRTEVTGEGRVRFLSVRPIGVSLATARQRNEVTMLPRGAQRLASTSAEGALTRSLTMSGAAGIGVR